MKEQKKQTINNIQKQNKNKISSGSKPNIEDLKKGSSLTVVIRISGIVGVPKDIENTLYRLKLRKKYVCVVINANNKAARGLLEKVKYYVAYGEINKETYDKLVKARGKKIDGKLKPFFRLHPPRGGINSKLQYPKGVLGDNKKDINKLIERML
jgi:large subunit ribosomal protein L30